VPGLREKLVPIAALNVRVCQYIGEELVGTDLAEPLATTGFEQEVNRFPASTPLPECSPQFSLMTFANNSQQVEVADTGCGVLTNGALTVKPTTIWSDELRVCGTRPIPAQHTASAPSTPTTAYTAPTQATIPATPIPLVGGPYGFFTPKGWAFTPLTNCGGPASYATWVNPSAPVEVIAYEASGGELGEMYNRDRSVNLAGALQAAGCPLASSHNLASNELTYTCSNAPSGTETRGVVIVRPAYQGWLKVQVTLAADLDETVSDILNSVH